MRANSKQRRTLDNGGEFRSKHFPRTVEELGAEHRFIRSDRPQTNGCFERFQGTVLEEYWKPTSMTLASHLLRVRTLQARQLELLSDLGKRQ